MDNWLLILVIAIFITGMVIGYFSGFLRIGINLLTTAILIALMIFITPPIAGLIINHTPISNVIKEQAMEAFMPSLTYEDMQVFDLSGTPLEGLTREQWEHLTPLDFQRAGITEETILENFGDIPRGAQMNLLAEAPIPDFFRTLLRQNNNPAIHELLGVTNFPEYAAAMVARIVVYLVAFLVSFILSFIIVKALLAAVDVIGDLPVAGVFNRIGGVILGLGIGLAVVWIGFLLVTVLYTTNVGMDMFVLIEESALLRFLFDNNIILNQLLRFG